MTQTHTAHSCHVCKHAASFHDWKNVSVPLCSYCFRFVKIANTLLHYILYSFYTIFHYYYFYYIVLLLLLCINAYSNMLSFCVVVLFVCGFLLLLRALEWCGIAVFSRFSVCTIDSFRFDFVSHILLLFILIHFFKRKFKSTFWQWPF